MKWRERRTVLRALDLFLILALVSSVVAGAAWYSRLRSHLRSARSELVEIEGFLASDTNLLDPAGMESIRANLARLDADLAAIEALTHPLLPLAPYLGWLPDIGGDVEAAPALLRLARHSIQAARAAVDGLAPLAQRFPAAGPGLGELGPDLVQGLAAARPALESAQESLGQAKRARNALAPERLTPTTRDLLSRFDGYLSPVAQGLDGLILLPALLGAEGPQTYLLLAQNNHELRATGGFISGAGHLTVNGGVLTELEFGDSYAIDDLDQPHPPAPDALRQQMGAGILLLRDANWWPDFPTSAQVAAGLYQQDRGPAVDGVLAVDLTTLRLLLEAIGPVQVPGYELSISASNLEAMLQQSWQAPQALAPGDESQAWWQARKDLAADLLAALVVRLTEQATAQELAGLVPALFRALEGAHTLVYSPDPGLQSLLHSTGWDGAQRRFEGDYLMVVDSNVGFNKVDPNIQRAIDYQVDLEPGGGAAARLTLSYRHSIQRPGPACSREPRYGDSYSELMERCYWNHLRVYVPAGSEISQVLGSDDPVQIYGENGYTVIATSFLLETGQARQIEIEYRPNVALAAGRYRLLVQKQAGTAAHPLRVGVSTTGDVQPLSFSPADMIWLDGQAIWQADLRIDREFELAWQ